MQPKAKINKAIALTERKRSEQPYVKEKSKPKEPVQMNHQIREGKPRTQLQLLQNK